jgi:TolB protein
MTQLTRDGQRKLAPVFTPDGSAVVYAAHEFPNLVSLQRYPLPDGPAGRLHPALTAHQFDPAFSPDGRYHAYALSTGSPQLVLVIQDTRDRSEVTFRPQDARATVRGLCFTPDGSRVVFGLGDVGGQQIASVNVRGQDLRRITQSAGLNVWPAVSPDGRHIAFSSSREGNYDIYVMDADGGGVRRLTDSPGLDVRPAWSPDGRRIAFVSNRDGCYALYVMDADGSRARRITHPPERYDYPTWHRDGRRLLAVGERGGKFDLYLVDVSD